MGPRTLFKMYQDVLIRRPYFVQAVQTGVLMAAGDVISQSAVEKTPLSSLDVSRTLRFSSIGFFVVVSMRSVFLLLIKILELS